MLSDIPEVSEESVKAAWKHNACKWIKLTEEGKDYYRDLVNTPGFFSILPDVAGLKGLDIGCGTGHNTRLLSDKGAEMSGIDLTEELVKFADSYNDTDHRSISYSSADATKLPFADYEFDFTTAFVSLIDMPNYKKAIQEAYRVLKPGGFFQFSVTHPCFWKPNMEWTKNSDQELDGVIVKDYFSKKGELLSWMFDGVPEKEFKFHTAHFHRTLSDWINATVKAGFSIEEILEPKPAEEAVLKNPSIKGSELVPYFLIIRGRKA